MVELMILTKVDFPGKLNRITVQYLVYIQKLLIIFKKRIVKKV